MESRRKKILVVDDDAEQRKIFSSYLAFVGYGVATAGDGEEALATARAERPELVLLDLRMPVLDGWQTLRRLLADPGTRHIPVLALTALKVDHFALYEAGFRGCLSKPIAPFEVLAEVERVIGGTHAAMHSPLPAVPREAYRPQDARLRRERDTTLRPATVQRG